MTSSSSFPSGGTVPSTSPIPVPIVHLPIEPAHGHCESHSAQDAPLSAVSHEEASNQNPTIPQIPIWGIDFSAVTMDESISTIDWLVQRGKPSHVITANVNFAMLHRNDPKLAELTRRADLVLCDGMPIYWRSQLVGQPLPERVAGSDLIYRIAELCAAKGYRIYFLGAAQGVAQEASNRLRAQFPGLKVAGVQCPAFQNLNQREHEAMLDQIRKARPDILLVALGQPKGEFWIDEHYKSLDIPVSIQLGASFDFVAGSASRAPAWMQKRGMEWLYRALRDPKRLVPRYAKNFLFLLRVIRRDILDATAN